jgi:cathepsin F
MDLTTEEFKKYYLNLNVNNFKSINGEKLQLRSGDVPEKFDWRDHGAVTTVKNQGMCGSCWAFSAVGNLEGQLQLKTGGSAVDLSPQQLVDCDKVDEGCNGGLMDTAFDYVKNAGGIEALSDYPYAGSDNTCQFDVKKSVAKVSGYKFAGTEDEEQIKAFLFQTGPLAIAINATPLQFYFWGIFNPWFTWLCDPEGLNHGVLLVGYGVEGSTKYWVVKNSWGSGWGEGGYFRIVRGSGACGLNKYVITATLQ